MFSMFHNKKGVSPIIAAVLLVVITIAIGATTMAFIRSLADENLQKAALHNTKISCGSDVRLEIPLVDNSYNICYNSTNSDIKVTLHNVGSKKIKGFDFTIIRTNGTVNTVTVSNSINNSEWKKIDFTGHNVSASTVSQWIIEPKIEGNPTGGDTICTDASIKRTRNEMDICT